MERARSLPWMSYGKQAPSKSFQMQSRRMYEGVQRKASKILDDGSGKQINYVANWSELSIHYIK